MTARDRVDARLKQFRDEWPSSVSWAEVRAEDPHVFRMAAQGALLTLLAMGVTLLATSLFMEVPWVVRLPAWLDWMRDLLSVVVLFLAISLWIFGLIMLSLPRDVRRGIAIAGFAQQRALMYSGYGFSPDRIGILLAEGRGRTVSRPARLAGAPPTNPALFRAKFALWQSAGPKSPPLQIAIAQYSGTKDDPKGPRHTFRYMELELPRHLPHLMIDARGNGSLRSFLPGTQRISLEGDFDRYFAVYVPNGYERDALELLTPDVMACLIDHGRGWDIEIVEDRLVVASHRSRRSSDRAEYTAMLYFSELVSGEVGHQAKTYTDPRSALPRSQIAEQGRRLRPRSAVWTTAAFLGVVALMLTFPYVLGWFLDR